MNTLILLCLSLVPAQDPDRSTPEKAFDSFIAFWQKVQEGSDVWEKLMTESEALGEFVRTDELKAKRKKQAEEAKKASEDWKTLSTNMVRTGTTENKDGTVTVEAKKTVKRRQKDFQSGKIEEIEESTPHRYVMEKSGANWYVKQIFNACWSCKGEGLCGSCKGTGKFGDNPCYACEGGKTCKSCKGEKLTEEKIAEGAPDFTIPDSEPKYSEDLSSAKAAAQTLADLKLHQDVLATQILRKFIDEALAGLHLYFHPTISKQVDEMFAKGVEEGKRRFREERPTVASVEEKGDVAYVQLKTKKDDEFAPRYVLKKVGAKWLLDAEQRKCYACKGSGTCEGCKGTGKSGEMDCYSCNGGKKCAPCKGEGWQD